MPLIPSVLGAFLLVPTQLQSEYSRYFPFDASSTPSGTIAHPLILELRFINLLAFPIPSWIIARLIILASRYLVSFIGRIYKLPTNNIATPATLTSLEIGIQYIE